MIINTKCNSCKEPTKYVTGFWDGKNGTCGCLYDCRNQECPVNQLLRTTESQAMQNKIRIQNRNADGGMYAGFIVAKRREAKISIRTMAQKVGCSAAEYSAYEHERKEFDPVVYRKCEEYLNKIMEM